MASKDIQITLPSGNEDVPKKRQYKSQRISDPEQIAKALADFTQLKSQKDCNVLIPGKTLIRYLDKKDRVLRKSALFINIMNDNITLNAGTLYWKVSLNNYEVYANLKSQEIDEKFRFLDFIEKKMNSKELVCMYKNKKVNWDGLLTAYIDE